MVGRHTCSCSSISKLSRLRNLTYPFTVVCYICDVSAPAPPGVRARRKDSAHTLTHQYWNFGRLIFVSINSLYLLSIFSAVVLTTKFCRTCSFVTILLISIPRKANKTLIHLSSSLFFGFCPIYSCEEFQLHKYHKNT